MKTTRKTATVPNEPRTDASGELPASIDGVQAHIAEMAYFLAEQRGFTPGSEMEDWLVAEAQLQARSDNA